MQEVSFVINPNSQMSSAKFTNKVQKLPRQLVQKRTDKNQPLEMSSKKPVTRKRTVVQVPAPTARDVRFDSLAGQFNPELFKKSYGFIAELQQAEMAQLKSQIQKEKDPETKKEMVKVLNSHESKVKAQQLKDRQQDDKRAWKKDEMQKVALGKKPYFLKEAQTRTNALVKKYKTIADKGGDIDKILEQRRKRNASKLKTRLPYKSRSSGN